MAGKNRTMQAKNAKLKKLRSKEIRDWAIVQMAHEPAQEIPKAYEPTEFESNFAMKRRIVAFMGKQYNIIRFQKRYPEIYEYLFCHTVMETKAKFQTEFGLIMQGKM